MWYLHLILCITQELVALNVIFIRITTEYLHPLVTVATRHCIGVPLMLIVAQFHRESRTFTPTKAQWKQIGLCAFLGVTVNTSLITVGVHNAGAITASIISATVPIVVCILSVAWKLEPMNKFKVFGFMITFSGATIVIGYHPLMPHQWQTFAFGCSMCFASVLAFSTFLVLQKPLMETIPVFYLQSRCFGVGFVGVVALALIVAGPEEFQALTSCPPIAIIGLLYQGVVSNVIAYCATAYVIKRATPTLATLYINVQPFLVAVMSDFFLGEAMHWNHFVGMCVVASGVIMGIYGRTLDKKAKPIPATPLEDVGCGPGGMDSAQTNDDNFRLPDDGDEMTVINGSFGPTA
eukprot:PhF_6_TR19250/c0_g1_i1/m.28298